jgi:hypothetical protein
MRVEEVAQVENDSPIVSYDSRSLILREAICTADCNNTILNYFLPLPFPLLSLSLPE